MEPLTQRELQLMEESFSLYDTRGDGKIDTSLLGEALRGLGLNPTDADVNKIVKELDSSGSKRISFEEFFPIFQSLNARADNDRNKKNKTDFIECFRVFDKDQNGTIAVGELQHVMCSLGESLTPEQVDLITQGMEDQQGMINIEDFVASVMEG